MSTSGVVRIGLAGPRSYTVCVGVVNEMCGFRTAVLAAESGG